MMTPTPTAESRTAEQRKARAREIAAKRGPKTVAIVERMDFHEADGREQALAATLVEKARKALQRHGGPAA